MKTRYKTLVVSTEKRFNINSNGDIVNEDNTRSSLFWERYLEVFEEIIVVARVDKKNLSTSTNFVENKQISVYELSNFQGLKEGLVNYLKLKTEISHLIKQHEKSAFLLRVPGSIGNQLGGVLSKRNLKYSLEIVGDPYEVYITQKGILSNILALKERENLRNLVKNAHSVAYVTQFSLQKKYPFAKGFQTYYSSIKLDERFFYAEKEFSNLPLSLIGVGSLEMPYKGVGFLLRALKLLDELGVPFKFTWVGNGKLLNEYQAFVVENSLSDKVNFIGSISNDKIPDVLQKNNVFVLPSLTEGLPRAMVEAMASSLICVGSNVGGIPELINAECIFESKNSNSIVELLKDIDQNFSYYRKFSKLNFEKAHQYCPKILNERRKSFYSSIEGSL